MGAAPSINDNMGMLVQNLTSQISEKIHDITALKSINRQLNKKINLVWPGKTS